MAAGKSKYQPIIDVERRWQQPHMKLHRLACCDCGLVHRVQFRAVTYPADRRKVYIEYRIWRDGRATAAYRREKKKRRWNASWLAADAVRENERRAAKKAA
ncbi:MAG: hypothetical protein AABZ67_00510 [Pseudomonadota bacterium]